MRNRGQFILGIILVTIGLLALLGRILPIDLGDICFPAGLILLGALILLRPQMLGPGTRFRLRPLADLRRRGPWDVASEEVWMFVGDVDLDFTEVDLPSGESVIRLVGFVGDVDIRVPETLPVMVSSSAFVTDLNAPGHREALILAPARWSTPTYGEDVSHRLRIELVMFVADLDIRS